MITKRTNVKARNGDNVVSLQEGNTKMATPTRTTTSAAPKGNVKTGPAASAQPASTKPLATDATAVGFVNPNAMSVDVGRQVVEGYRVTREEEKTLEAQLDANARKQNGQLRMLTEAFVRAAKNDKRINLALGKSDKGEDIRDVRQRLEVAIGIRHVIKNEDGTQKVELAPWTREYFPQPGEDKSSDGWRAKENFRTNFAAQFKKCIGAASTIVSENITTSIDEKTGALMISGPKVKERFNVDSVVLNEKRDVVKEDGTKVKLAKIPSFTELDRMASEKAGKTLTTRVDSRARGAAAPTDAQLLSMVKSITLAIAACKNFSDDLAEGLTDLADAIDKALEQNTGLNEAAAEGAAEDAAQAATTQ